MSDVPARASAVVIGAGIVGNSLVHHLALLGWKDVVLVDKGPLPNPGGSTGHASNFIFPIEYSRLMFELTGDSTEQYKALGVFTESGGIEAARTPERMQELKRRVTRPRRGASRPSTSLRRACRNWSPTWTRPSSWAAATSPRSALSTACGPGR